MTYHKYGLIQAATYNAYAAIINSIYADTNAGSIIESSADYGYGLSPAISTVATGNNITAAQWTLLFSKIHTIGTHQGTSVYPIPSSVSAGDLVSAYNNYLTTQTLTDVISLLIANRLLANGGDIANISGPTSPTSPAWGSSTGTKTLSYAFQIDFSSWDNARHFFNTGSSVGFFGSCTDGLVGSENHFWKGMLEGMSTLKFSWHDTLPSTGAGSTVGFYDLTNTGWTKLYERSPVSGGIYYSNNYILISGQLVDAPGVSGKVNLKIELVDNDPAFDTILANSISYNINLFQSTLYPGPAVVNNAGTFSTSASSAFTGIPLTLTSSQPTVFGSYDGGAGTATTGPVTITAAGGSLSYTYLWTMDAGSATINSPTSATTTLSMLLTDGQIISGTAKCTVSDGVNTPVYILIPWSMNSNSANIVGP